MGPWSFEQSTLQGLAFKENPKGHPFRGLQRKHFWELSVPRRRKTYFDRPEVLETAITPAVSCIVSYHIQEGNMPVRMKGPLMTLLTFRVWKRRPTHWD